MGMFEDLVPQKAAGRGMPGTANPTPAPPIAGVGPGGTDVQWMTPGYIPPPAPVEPEAPAPLSSDRVGPGVPSLRELQIGGQALGRGGAEFAFGLGDLVNGLINSVAGLAGKEPVLGYPSEIVRGAAGKGTEAVGVKPIEETDMSPVERGAYTVNRMGTTALLGGTSLNALAQRSPRAPLPSRSDAFLDPYRQNAGRALAVDTAAGAGSGAGNAIYNENVPEDAKGPIGELVATLLGGVGGASAANITREGAKGAVGGAKRLASGSKFDKAIPKDADGMPVTKNTARAAGAFYQNEAVDPQRARINIDENQKFYQENGLPEPSVGALADDYGISGVDRAARTKDPKEFLVRDSRLRQAQADKLRSMADDVPEGDRRAAQELAAAEAGKMRDSAAAAKSEVQGKVSDLEGQIDANKQDAAELSAPVRATAGTKEQSSIQARAAVDAEKAATKKVADDLYDKVDPTTPVTFDNSVAAARAAKKSVGQTGSVPQIVDRIIDARAEVGGPAPFSELKADLENVNGAIRVAEAAGDAQSVRLLNQVKDGVLKDLDAAGSSNDALKDARGFYATEYAPKFKEGASKAALGPKGLSSKTLDTYTATKEGADQLRSIVGEDERAVSTVQNYVMSKLAQGLPDDPAPKQLRQFIDKNSHMWDAFPEVKKSLETFYKDVLNNRISREDLKAWHAELKRDLGYAERNAADVEQVVNRGVLRKLIDNDPENAVKAILSGGDPEKQMQDAVALIAKDKTGRAGKAFKASVRDYLEGQFTGARTETTSDGDFAVMQGKMESFLKKPGVKQAIDRVWKDDPQATKAMATARRIATDMAKLNVRATAGSDTESNKVLVNNLLKPVEIGVRFIHGALEGASIMRKIRLSLSAVPGLDNTYAVQRLIQRAALDGDLAKHLLGIDAVKMPQKTWTPKLNRLIGYAEAAREVDKEE